MINWITPFSRLFQAMTSLAMALGKVTTWGWKK